MLTTDPLFKGLTRPPMLFGIPMVPFIALLTTVALIAIWTTKWVVVILPPALIIMKFLVKDDDFIFNLLFQKVKFFMNTKTNNSFYGEQTISTQKYRDLPKKISLPPLSIFGLDKNPSLEQFLPYSSVIADDTVITKDFYLIQTWKLDGVAFEIESDEDIDADKHSLNMLIKAQAGTSLSFYTHQIRHTIEDHFDHSYNNKFIDDLNKQYYRGFTNGSLKSNSLYITVVYNPFSGRIEKADFKGSSFKSKMKELKYHLRKLNEITDKIQASLKRYNPKKLGTYIEDDTKYNSQLEFINYLMSGEKTKVREFSAPIYEYLTGNLQNIQFNKSMMQLNLTTGKKKFARIVEFKDYGVETYSGILDTLLYLNIDYTITQSFSSLPKHEAKDKLTTQKTRLMSSEDDGVSQIEEIDAALDDLINGKISFGMYHFSIIVYGDTPKAAKDNTNEIIKELADQGFVATIADIALPHTYFSQFPANFALRPRVSLISSKNYAGLIALHNFPKGKREKNCWGDAMMILKTPSQQPYYLNLHETHSMNDFGKFHLGNTLVIGKSGGGKTAFLSFLQNSATKYHDPLTFPEDHPTNKKNMMAIYLDKDKGAIGNIYASGGKYLSVESGKPTGFNPFMCENTPKNITKLQNLIKLLVTRNGEKLSSDEEKKLTDAINAIMTEFAIEEREYPISLLLEHLTDPADGIDSIKDRLTLWKKGNKFGWVFDNSVDELDFDAGTNIYGIDGTEFLDDHEVSAPLSYYILWRIMDLMDGRRLGVYIDEAWKWIENPMISDEIKNKLKTNRKLNSFIVLVVQSVEDFLKNKNARAIIEQSSTMIFFPNTKAVKSEYVEGLKCTPEEYDLIRALDPSTYQFIVKKYDEKVRVSLDLSHIDPAYIKILSTGKPYVDMVEKIFKDSDSSYDEKLNQLIQFYKGEE